MFDELKTLIEDQGRAFEAFKATHAELKKADTVTADKLARIEQALDAAVEAKAALDARLTVEATEREALELRLTRKGSGSEADEKDAKSMTNFVRAHAAGNGRPQPAAFDAASLAAYKSAQAIYLRGGDKRLGPDEQKAMLVGSDPQGGYLVTPDVSGRIVMRMYETSPIRQVANAITISTDAIEGIEDLNEAGAGWVGETEARPETATPDVGKWRIPAHEMYAEPRVTQKLLDDAAVDVEAWLAQKVADRLGRLENTAFVTGNGVARPRGFTDYPTALDSGTGVAWGSIGHVVTGVSGGFAAANPADCLFDLIGLLKPAYLPNARFVTRRSIVTAIRKFKDGLGNYLWQPGLSAGASETLLGYPILRAEDMAAAGANSRSLYFGDFREGYQIVDRAGIRMLNDPYTAKPYVKFYTTKRTGGGMLNFEALKALVFSA